MRLEADTIEEKRRAAESALATVRDFGMPTIYIPTHNRWENVQTITTCPELAEHSVLVVDADQEELYDLYYPEVKRLVVPLDYAGVAAQSAGRKRRYILEHGVGDHIVMVDDDVLNARLMACKPERGVTTTVLRDWTPNDRVLACMALFTTAMDDAYAASPRAVSGAPQSTAGFPRTFPKESNTRWTLNTQDPFFCISFRRDRWWDLVGYHLDLDRYGAGAIGEDKGLTLAAMKAGCNVVDVPSILLNTNPPGKPGETIVGRSKAIYAKASDNYRQYPSEWFSKPRWNEDLQEHDSWNINFRAYKEADPSRVLSALWTD